MAIVLAPPAKQQFFDTDGAPLAGGLLYTYETGTGQSIPLATYSDLAGVTPNANPIVLDSRGECTIYLTTDEDYDWVLRRPDNTIVWTRTNITGSDPVIRSDDGAGLIKFMREDGTTTPLSDQVREKLPFSRTYYVRPDGNDSNTGLVNSAGGAWLTIQKAINHVRDNIDPAGYFVIIQLAAGTYTTGFFLDFPITDGNTLVIQGNTGAPSTVVISTTNQNGAVVRYGARALIRGIKFQTTTAGSAILAQYNSTVEFNAIEFGECAGDHIAAVNGSTVLAVGSYSVSGGAINHWHSYDNGTITVQNVTVTISGSPTMTRWAGAATGGNINSLGCTFTGTLTGARFFSRRGSIINTEGSGLTYLPGTVAGTADGATGGYYV